MSCGVWRRRNQGEEVIIRRGKIVQSSRNPEIGNEHRDICPLKIVCFNTRSITNKLPDLHHLILLKDLDIIGISESWLSSGVESNTLALNDNEIFRADRNHGNDPHGGVLLALKWFIHPRLTQ